MRVTRQVFFVFLLYLPFSAFSQISLVELERAWLEDRFDDLRLLLPAAERAYPHDFTVLFFRAFLHDDADQAFSYYESVVNSARESRYHDTALFKMAQYQYAKERYVNARFSFQLLQKHFPQSKWVDDCNYLIGQCYLAEGKTDSARAVWQDFIKKYPRSPYSDLAVADLEHEFTYPIRTVQHQARKEAERIDNSYYSIQVGAFSKMENARMILTGLEKVGYDGEIVEKNVGSRVFHAVWIGKFTNRADAEDYAKRFIVQVTQQYHIVKSEN